jgi:phosphoribosylanthranilate isomerase
MWIKICGMTDEAAVAAALEAGADAIGFVFAPSVRRLDPAAAARLARPARGRLACVAVLRHPEPALLERVLEAFRPDVLQTDVEDFETLELPGELERLPVLRSGATAPARLPQRLLFEGPRSGAGDLADWTQAQSLARQAELVLAGGLSAENVAAAIARVHPFGVDVSSGVERAPGIKSAEKIARFVDAARAAHLESSR